MFDGTYTGERTITGESAPFLVDIGMMSRKIKDGKFSYAYDKILNAVLMPEISQDGSFDLHLPYGRGKTARIKGHISAGNLVADVEGDRFGHHLSLRKN